VEQLGKFPTAPAVVSKAWLLDSVKEVFLQPAAVYPALPTSSSRSPGETRGLHNLDHIGRTGHHARLPP
jgi:hypothetical protein